MKMISCSYVLEKKVHYSLRRLIGRLALARRHRFFRREPDGTESFHDPETHYLARLDRIDKLVSGIIIVAGLLMLVIP